MKTFTSLMAAAMLISAPAMAQDVLPPAAPAAPAQPVTPAPAVDAAGVYQVFRVTDNQLNCEQLISEMNMLNAAIKTQTEQAAQSQNRNQTGRRIGGAALGGALGGLARGTIARNVPGLGYTGAVAAMSATDAASNAVGNAVGNGQPGAAPTTATNEQQRLNRVSQLFGAKGC